MEQEVNLVDLQRNLKAIRNPFGFDFTITWGGKPYTIPGDGSWRRLLPVLADHAARHLYMKVRYQYHDEQVEKLKQQGSEKMARRYAVPKPVENKIWKLITGDNLQETNESYDEAKADLSVISEGLSLVDKAAIGSSSVSNISSIIDQANEEAISSLSDDSGDSGHSSGNAALNPAASAPANDGTIVDKQNELTGSDTQTKESNEQKDGQEDGFDDLKENQNG